RLSGRCAGCRACIVVHSPKGCLYVDRISVRVLRLHAFKSMCFFFFKQKTAYEIIESIVIPKLSRAGRYGFYKFCRKTGEFAEASAAAVFDPESGVANVFLGALRGTPQPLASLAQQVAKHGESAASTEFVNH